MNLDAMSEQAEMDEMALNDELSKMVTSIRDQQTQLQAKINADTTKQHDLQVQIRDLQQQYDNITTDLAAENKTFHEFSQTAAKIEEDRRKVQQAQVKMVSDLKADSDKLQRSSIESGFSAQSEAVPTTPVADAIAALMLI